MPEYPSPCDSCLRDNKDSCNGKACDRWLRRYHYRQKQINAWAKRLCGQYGQRHIWLTHWVYMHPDEYRRYLVSNPCDGCLCSSWCDDPCPKYLTHFADKMEYLRKRAMSHEQP